MKNVVEKMVDLELLNEVKAKLDSSNGETSMADTFKFFEVYKQISLEEKGLKDEFEDMDMLNMDFLGQIIISDENKKCWFKFKECMVDYGEGEIENPSLIFTTTIEIFNKILFGEIEISSAHEAGDITYEGSPESLMDFQSIMFVLNDYIGENM